MLAVIRWTIVSVCAADFIPFKMAEQVRAARKTSTWPNAVATVRDACSRVSSGWMRWSSIGCRAKRSAHETIVEDVECFGRILLLAQDQRYRRFHLRRNEQSRHLFDNFSISAMYCSRACSVISFRLGGMTRCVSYFVQDRADMGQDVFTNGLENREIQAFLAAEVVADQRLVDLGAACDFAIARGVITVAGKFADCRLDQGASGGIASVHGFAGFVHTAILINRLIKSSADILAR